MLHNKNKNKTSSSNVYRNKADKVTVSAHVRSFAISWHRVLHLFPETNNVL